MELLLKTELQPRGGYREEAEETLTTACGESSAHSQGSPKERIEPWMQCAFHLHPSLRAHAGPHPKLKWCEELVKERGKKVPLCEFNTHAYFCGMRILRLYENEFNISLRKRRRRRRWFFPQNSSRFHIFSDEETRATWLCATYPNAPKRKHLNVW